MFSGRHAADQRALIRVDLCSLILLTGEEVSAVHMDRIHRDEARV
jgi:hypothetical protein